MTKDSVLIASQMFFNQGTACLKPHHENIIHFFSLHFPPLILLLLLPSSDLKLHEAFVNQSQEFYNAVPQKLTNDSEVNVKMINNWVASKTQNQITELVDHFDESNEFILLNAVYFIGQWPCSHLYMEFILQNSEVVT